MSNFYAFLFGLVEGLTEYLPISSTGHMMVLREWLEPPTDPAFQKSFEIVIQFGAILAVVVVYWRALMVDRRTMLLVIAGFIPTGILGYLLHHQVDKMQEHVGLVLWSFAIGGVIIILFERLHGEAKIGPDSLQKINLWEGVVIGTFQAVAMVPGVSRSAVTVLAGLGLGIKRRTAVEYSFLLAVPTMAAASGFKLMQQGSKFTSGQWEALSIGFVMSFIVGLLTVKLLLRFVKTHTFEPFGYYRIAAALVFGYLLFWRA